MNGYKLAQAATLSCVALMAQTSHESDTGGNNGSVTIYTRSHTHLDKGILQAAGLSGSDSDGKARLPGDTEIWRHGHPGPRILRVIIPDPKKKRNRVDGATIIDSDKVEINLIDPTKNSESLGIVTLRRDIRKESSFLTNGHAANGQFVDLRPCYDACSDPVRPVVSDACSRAKAAIEAKLDAEASADPAAKSGTVWIYQFENGRPLRWIPKSPSAEGIRQIITSGLQQPVRFDFSLVRTNPSDGSVDPKGVLMRNLKVSWANGRTKDWDMPKDARFEVCNADEKSNSPKCEPLPECQGFWRRHFDKGCRLYGGTGVLTDYDPKKHSHSHH